jgi:predicted ATPase
MMPNIDGIEVEVGGLGEVELRLRERNVAIPARVLSENTLRILGLLALVGVKDAPTLVGFEEPENGIHPRRIQLIAELFKTRASLGQTQYIVTTHSPILPDLLPDDALFVVRRFNGQIKLRSIHLSHGNRLHAMAKSNTHSTIVRCKCSPSRSAY